MSDKGLVLSISADSAQIGHSEKADRFIRTIIQTESFGIVVIAKSRGVFNLYSTGGLQSPEPKQFLGSVKMVDGKPVIDQKGDLLQGLEAEKYFYSVTDDDGLERDEEGRLTGNELPTLDKFGATYASPEKGYWQEPDGTFTAFENEEPLFDNFIGVFDSSEEAVEWLNNPDKESNT
ncbi:MAG: hypothetical protein HPY53_01490 [Brevinematales bacterium]|nr:hypothetical protein [Brevinematales bacterium]